MKAHNSWQMGVTLFRTHVRVSKHVPWPLIAPRNVPGACPTLGKSFHLSEPQLPGP